MKTYSSIGFLDIVLLNVITITLTPISFSQPHQNHCLCCLSPSIYITGGLYSGRYDIAVKPSLSLKELIWKSCAMDQNQMYTDTCSHASLYVVPGLFEGCRSNVMLLMIFCTLTLHMQNTTWIMLNRGRLVGIAIKDVVCFAG